MTNVKEFNPIETARKVEDSYREYIATTIHFDDADLQKQLETILCEPGISLQRDRFLRRRLRTARIKLWPNWWTRGYFARA